MLTTHAALHRAKFLLWVFAVALIASSAFLLAYGSDAAPSGVTGLAPASQRVAPLAGAAIPNETPIPFAYSPQVAQMIAGVQQSQVYSYTGYLSGKFPLTVGGESFTLKTRNTYYPAYGNKATQYEYEFLQGAGLAVSYQDWYDAYWDVSGRNVIGEIRGATRPNEIVLISAHLDDMPIRAVAPGADDNASGSVGVMMAASRLAGHTFERTIRFVFFTGEEDGYLGSYAYAQQSVARNENIVGVFNMDMLGWDGNNDGLLLLHIRKTTNPAGSAADRAIAEVLTQVVSVYGLNGLAPRIRADGESESDHSSFWDQGIPAVLAIEDDWIYEENPYYHTQSDTIETLNMPFFTNYVKAVVGTAAHLAIPVGSDIGTATPTPTPTITPTPTLVKPSSPALLAPTNGVSVNTRQVALDWSDADRATRYKVQVRRGSTTGDVVDRQKKLTTSQYSTVALKSGRRYFWRVRACNAQGCSVWTAYWNFQVRAP
ncbi:MAG: M20/M25/M40 family metallo-hydrolase [Chloroflexi bacterium]|nr:M20/M25/M40 family metallo-hydrolase [Chloroflexota bacterium]